jgi:hypothetical protein
MISSHLLLLLPKDRKWAIHLADFFERRRHGVGDEQFVSQIKALKVAMIQRWAGNPDWIDGLEWIKKNREGLPAGPISRLFKGDPSDHLKEVYLSILSVDKLFTKRTDHSLRQATEEAISFITAPYTGCEIPEKVPEGLLPGRVNSPTHNPTFNLAGFTTSKAGSLGYTGNQWMDSWIKTWNRSHPYMEFIRPTYKEHVWRRFKPSPIPSTFEGPHVGNVPTGKLHFLQEKGLKVRTICIPDSEFQAVLQPFHKALASYLATLPQDCTVDQDKGAEWCKRKLAQGFTLHSVDLKSATDRFPRKLQLAFARSIGMSEEWIQAFDVIVKAPQIVSPGRYIQYSVGQPMGFYGSFPLLALGQHGLVRWAARIVKKDPADRYVVLGDDIVISDDDIAAAYQFLLDRYGIPVSHHKCVTSDKVAEFAGYLITGKSTIKPVKPVIGSMNLDKALQYTKLRGSIPSSMRKWIALHILAHAPEEHGGLGLNPAGYSLETRYDWLDPEYSSSWESSMAEFFSPELVRSELMRLLYTDNRMITVKGQIVKEAYEHLDAWVNSIQVDDRHRFIRSIPGGFYHLANMYSHFLYATYRERLSGVPSSRYVKKKFGYFFVDQDGNEKARTELLP